MHILSKFQIINFVFVKARPHVDWAIVFNILTPPVEDLPLLLTLDEFHKIALTLKTSIKYGSTPEDYGFNNEEFREKVNFPCSSLKILLKINKVSPLKNSISFLLYSYSRDNETNLLYDNDDYYN